jgi:hypothetical protein
MRVGGGDGVLPPWIWMVRNADGLDELWQIPTAESRISLRLH